ncbi:MAG: NfeD family protein [Rhodoplanes sp.]|jgi:inner membrane protein
MSLIASLEAWNWFIAAGILLILEVLLPGTFMLWLGIAAVLVGLISLLVDWPWQLQCVAFAAFALALIPLWRRLAKQVGGPTDQPYLNRRADALVGRMFTLEKPIIGGVGAIAVDDTVWRVRGDDSPAGSRVKVTRVDGATIYVERVTG